MLPYLFEIFGYKVPSYGFFIAMGLIACGATFLLLIKKKGMPESIFDNYFNAALFAILGGFGSAALFQGFYNCQATGEFKFGGITFMGGIIGGVIIFILYTVFLIKDPKIKQAFWDVADMAPACIVIAHCLGRIGCLLAGCCYGAPNEVWGLAYVRRGDPTLRLPVQLYESLFLFLMYAISVAYALKTKKRGYGVTLYAVPYGIWRFCIEFLRDDYRGGSQGALLSPSQVQSIVFIVVGIAYFVLVYMLRKKKIIEPAIDWTDDLTAEAERKQAIKEKKLAKKTKKEELKNEKITSYEEYNKAVEDAQSELEKEQNLETNEE